MKIAILGAGAMGCLYASYLCEQHEVALFDSYLPQLDAIQRYGVTRVEKDGTERLYRVRAKQSGLDDGEKELVIVFVKSNQTLTAIAENLRLIGPDTIVLTLQNGAGNNRDIARFVPRENIIVGSSSHNSVNLLNGRIFHSGCGPTNLGPDFPCERSSAYAEQAANALQDCGIEAHVVENIQQVLWKKLFVNCGINALSTIMDCKIGLIRSNPSLWELCVSTVKECVRVASADGTDCSEQEVLDIVRAVAENDAEGCASMCQDRRSRRKTEIDRINGVVVRLGEDYQIETPCNRMLVQLVHAIESTYPA